MQEQLISFETAKLAKEEWVDIYKKSIIMRKQEFTIPENADKVSVEEINGKIIIEFIPNKIIPKNGDIVRATINFRTITGIYYAGWVTSKNNDRVLYDNSVSIEVLNNEERDKFLESLKDNNIEFSFEKHRFIPIKWVPKENELVYVAYINSRDILAYSTRYVEFYDKKFLERELIFKTKEEAENKAIELINYSKICND